ncbi:MAG: HEAT repeat domain-containing protein [Planctomycetes bacterium]|nr:HEAT repeat domain-containing protein [Planctomycetota bacterium]
MRIAPPLAALALLAAPLAAPLPAQSLTLRDGLVRIEEFHAAAVVEEGVARVVVEETFRNTTDRVQEGVFRFQLPEDAVIGAFSMWMAGREQQGKVLEAKEARATYDAIVRKQKDPGLLEQVGWRDFRVNVFPIPARDTVRIKLSYAHVVRDDLGLETLEIPLPHDAGAVGDLQVHATWHAQRGLAGLDSPSHPDAKLSVVEGGREGCGEARFASDGVVPVRRFELRALPRRDGFDLALLAHRPAGAEEGFFLARVVPRLAAPPRIGRDLVFVVDRSGSMAGVKLEQARAALLAGLATLKPGDRFDVVSFSSDVTSLARTLGRRGLLDVSSAHVSAARQAAAELDATGGTNIQEALLTALKGFEPAPERLAAIVFLTDGDPTVGETQPERLLAAWRAACGSTRLFAFGVGNGVKEFLLSKLASEGRGAARYVEEGDDLEVPLAALYERLKTPLLLEPTFEIEGAGITVLDREPRRLPDLCQQRALLIAGRYRGSGAARLHLRGIGEQGRVDLVVPIELPAATPARPHVAQLWAKTRVERLLDDLRIGGPNAEIADEVKRLGLDHALVTPYTSFLVLEPQPLAAANDATRRTVDDGTTHDRLPADSVPASAGGPAAPAPGSVTSGASGFLTGRAKASPGGGNYNGPNGTAPTTGGMGARRSGGEGFERWEFWWEHRKEALLAAARPSSRAPLPAELQRELLPALLDALQSDEAEVAEAAALALARACVPERAYVGDRVVPALLQALHHSSAKVRRTVTVALGITGRAEAIEPLCALLADRANGDALQRAFAATALGLLHADAARADLWAATASEAPIDVAACAVLALGQMSRDHEALLEPLLARLDDRSLNVYVRAQVPAALVRLAEQSPTSAALVRRHLAALVERFAHDRTDQDLRRSLALALGRLATLADEAVFTALTEAVVRSNDDQTRHFALYALAELGARDADIAAHEAEHDVLEAFLLRELTQPKRITHQPHAALALGLYLQNRALPAETRERIGRKLQEMLTTQSNPSYQGAMALALGWSDCQAALPALLQLLEKTNDTGLKGYLAQALALLHADGTAPLLRAKLDAAGLEPRTRLQYARALAMLRDHDAVEPLLRLLQHGATLIESTAAAQALGQLRDRAAFEPLLALAADPQQSPLARGLAVTALGLLADPDPQPWNAALGRDVNYRAKVAALAELLDLP